MKKVLTKEIILYGLIIINILIFVISIFFFYRTIRGSSELIVPPDVRGRSIEEATDILSRNNFKVVIRGSLIDKNKDPLIVLDQNPLITKMPPGSIISLWINMPAKIVKIPDLRYKDVGEARNIAEKLGLKVEVINGENSYVIKQLPEAGLYIEKGATISLYTYTEDTSQSYTPSENLNEKGRSGD